MISTVLAVTNRRRSKSLTGRHIGDDVAMGTSLTVSASQLDSLSLQVLLQCEVKDV